MLEYEEALHRVRKNQNHSKVEQWLSKSPLSPKPSPQIKNKRAQRLKTRVKKANDCPRLGECTTPVVSEISTKKTTSNAAKNSYLPPDDTASGGI